MREWERMDKGMGEWERVGRAWGSGWGMACRNWRGGARGWIVERKRVK